MSKSYAVLPCNGLDKCAGGISREVALVLSESTDSEIICPVFYRVADVRYNKLAQEKPLLVIDGCATRCASKLAAEKNLKIAEKINITEEAKSRGVALTQSLRLGENEMVIVKEIINKVAKEQGSPDQECDSISLPESLAYEVYKKDKFIFRVPKNSGFYFNENDVWVYVVGNKARVGVTDYVQQSLSDIMFFTSPALGAEIEQFEEVGNIESGKAVFEIISPVSGTITAINERLLEAPELINQNPYEDGWITEMELSDFAGDKELILDFEGYFPVLKRKVDEFHV
ncbi:MAG TPA: glycine cleavage system protein H [Desulfitobacterium dehalogenans]|uniref:Glycine cleavage system protein H n=1 Tax=Desulfitobacterium dehalogenans TaxID=36854 RepID=A0A7C6Z4F3_9FIRM|nr:glycine cleavage system protein H [Desulfitobacterium dehalogenans]